MCCEETLDPEGGAAHTTEERLLAAVYPLVDAEVVHAVEGFPAGCTDVLSFLVYRLHVADISAGV